MLVKVRMELENNKKQLTLLFVYTFLLVFFCSKMSPFYPIQEWSDINLYFNVGKAIMNGQTLYTDSFDHKGPIIFLIYGIGYLISNDSFLGMFVIQFFCWLILSITAYFTAIFFLSKTHSFIVAVLFLPIFMSHTLEGGAAEEFVTVFMGISLYLFIRYFRETKEPHRYSHMAIHGIMFALAFFIKFNLVVFWIFPLLAIGVIMLSNKQCKELIYNILCFVLGTVVIALPILIYFLSKNALTDAYDIYFTLNTGRVEAVSSIVSNIAVRFYQRLRFETLEFSLILLGAFGFPLLYIKNWFAKIGLALSFCAVFAVIFMATGYVYYYSIPYYIYAILGLVVLLGALSRFVVLKGAWDIYILVFIIGVSASLWRKEFFGKCNQTHSENVVEKFSKILKNDKDATLLNLGLDNANAVFTYANVMPNVQYFLSPNFTYDDYPRMRDEQTRYIDEQKTKYVILTEYSINFQYFNTLYTLQENYAVIDSCKEFFPWVNDDRTYYLYKRKENE